MKHQLNENEISNIEAFCKNKDMYNAVKKFLLAGIYSHGVIKAGEEHNPLINGAFSLASLAVNNPIPDVELGAHIRGMWAGVNALESAFEKLDTVKSTPEVVLSEYNEAE